jgi:carboxynorspermidine decarboxylase
LAAEIDTPAFIIDERTLVSDLTHLRQIADKAGCRLLYSPKANAVSTVLKTIGRQVDGFACSSLYELQLVDQICGTGAALHLVSPLIGRESLKMFGGRLAHVTFNSLSQWQNLRSDVSPETRVALRVNPQLSFIRDPRYDPCRQNSKLGIPIVKLAELYRSDPGTLAGIDGLHFHNNCEGMDFAGLVATARHIQDVIPELLGQINWINIGGGYLFRQIADLSDFYEAVSIFREQFGLEVFIEPGAATVRRSGTIEATVHDLFESDGIQVAVLDTSVNHMPEILEFQFEPDVLGYIDGGLHTYILAGCTCLAGDVFGEYSFDRELKISSRVTFLNSGAYTMSKAHRFNGVELPTIYHRHRDGTLETVSTDRFEEFARSAGVADVGVS